MNSEALWNDVLPGTVPLFQASADLLPSLVAVVSTFPP